MSTATTMYVAGQTAIVTGASSGIGLATARLFEAGGMKVCRLDVDLGGNGGIKVDVTDPEACEQVVATLVEKGRYPEVLVNCAGLLVPDDANAEERQRMFDVNVMGMFNMVNAVKGAMIEKRRGSIVNISSIVAQHGWPNRGLYCASKGAVDSATRALALELAPYCIRVNAVAPGLVSTPMIKRVIQKDPEPARAHLLRSVQQSSGCMLSSDQVAKHILFLASNWSEGISGATLDASDGRLAGHVANPEAPGPRYRPLR